MNQYFNHASTLEELRKQYKNFLKQYHSDNTNGSTEIIQEINTEYDFAEEKSKMQNISL